VAQDCSDEVQGLNGILRNMFYCCNLTKFMIMITKNTLKLFKIMNVDVGGDEWCDNVWQQSPRGNKIDSKMNI